MKGLSKKVKKNAEKSDTTRHFPNSLVQDYEDLRTYALGNVSRFKHPLGLDLFLKKGFSSWMVVLADNVILHGPAAVVDKTEKPLLPQDLQYEITLLLANMILEGVGKNVSIE